MKCTSKYPLLILFMFSLLSCQELAEGDIEGIEIFNNSIHSIIISVSYSYPDTSLFSITSKCSSILPGETCDAKSLHGWKGDIASNPSGIIIFFVSDIDTIKKYGAETSMSQYMILARYDLSEKDLDSMNWRITYPATIK